MTSLHSNAAHGTSGTGAPPQGQRGARQWHYPSLHVKQTRLRMLTHALVSVWRRMQLAANNLATPHGDQLQAMLLQHPD